MDLIKRLKGKKDSNSNFLNQSELSGGARRGNESGMPSSLSAALHTEL